MSEFYNFSRITSKQSRNLSEVRKFLALYDLGIDDDVEYFIVAEDDKQRIVACGGLAGNILKSIAISYELRGSGFALTLMSKLTALAYELNRFKLFLFTKPENVHIFRQCGFYLIEKVTPYVALMENRSDRILSYCQQLASQRKAGDKIAAIVMNANPFTLGHQYLIEQACSQCDWLHLFVVQAEQAGFSYRSRVQMIRSGTRHLHNLTIHAGGDYIISRVTFPTYFIKEQKIIDATQVALDLRIFRHYIAPALGITHRYVGSEPLCAVTHHYNQAMRHWLEQDDVAYPAVKVVEISRCCIGEQPVSASRVRQLFQRHDFESIFSLVPESTYLYLSQHVNQACQQARNSSAVRLNQVV